MPLVEDASAANATTFVLKLKQPLTATLDLFDRDLRSCRSTSMRGRMSQLIRPILHPSVLGPFKFKSWASGQSITFVRNKITRDKPEPYLNSVVFALIPIRSSA